MLPSIWRSRSSLLSPSFDDFIERFFYGWPSFEKESDVSWAPRMDIHETENEFVLDIEIPGMDKKDIKIGVKNDILTISGERKKERETREKDYSSVERHYGKFERSLTLSETVNAEKIIADYKNGLLTLTLPKTEDKKLKELSVEVK